MSEPRVIPCFQETPEWWSARRDCWRWLWGR